MTVEKVYALIPELHLIVDEELKRKSEAIFSDLGMSLSTALTIFLKYSVRYGGIPFELRIETPNATTRATIEDVNANRNMSQTFDSVDALMEDLNA